MAEFPQRVRRAEKGPVLQDCRRRCISLLRVAASRHISMALARLAEVEGGMILVFGRVVTKCRLAFAVCATLTLPSELAAYRISSFRFVNPRKYNIQAMRVWTGSSVRLSFVAISQALSLCRPSDKLGLTLTLFPKRRV